MSYGIVIAEPPVTEPVTLAQAKAHLNVGHNDDSDLINALITAAREQTEAETGRCWIEQTITLSLTAFPSREDPGTRFQTDIGPCWHETNGVPSIIIPFQPVSSVDELRYYDAAGDVQTLTEGVDFLAWLSHSPPIIYPAPGKYWPLTQAGRLGAVEVDCVVGYADASAVPATAKQAMLLAIGQWYEHRGDSEEPAKAGLPMAAIRLLRTLHTGHYS